MQLIDCLYRHLYSDDLTASCSHSNFNLVTTVADGEVVLVRQCLVGVSLWVSWTHTNMHQCVYVHRRQLCSRSISYFTFILNVTVKSLGIHFSIKSETNSNDENLKPQVKPVKCQHLNSTSMIIRKYIYTKVALFLVKCCRNI